MKVRATDHRPLTGIDEVTFNVSRDDSVIVMMARRPPGKVTPEEALSEAVKGLRTYAKMRDVGKLKATAWQAKVAGEVRKGVRLTATTGDDPECSGVVVLPFSGRLLVIGFQAPRSRCEEALAAFRMIAASLAVAKAGERVAPTSALELKIGNRAYAIKVDWPFDIEGPDGKMLRATLRRGEKVYAGSGIDFEYPGDMTTRTENKTGRVMIHVEHGDAYFAMLQIFFVPGITRESVQSLSVKYVRSNVEGKDTKFGPEKSCRQRFLGKSRTGTLLVTEGGDDPYRIEIYSFEIGKRVISVLFFCRESNRKTAERAFRKIAKSLGEVE